MNTTFSCVLCLLLVAACRAETAFHKDLPGRLLQQAISHVNALIKKDKDNFFVYSPTNDIKECCSQSALECFADMLNSTSEYLPREALKLNKNLRKSFIINSVKTCSNEEIQEAKCMSCESYPKVSSKQFLNNLLSYLQKAFSRLP